MLVGSSVINPKPKPNSECLLRITVSRDKCLGIRFALVQTYDVDELDRDIVFLILSDNADSVGLEIGSTGVSCSSENDTLTMLVELDNFDCELALEKARRNLVAKLAFFFVEEFVPKTMSSAVLGVAVATLLLLALLSLFA